MQTDQGRPMSPSSQLQSRHESGPRGGANELGWARDEQRRQEDSQTRDDVDSRYRSPNSIAPRPSQKTRPTSDATHSVEPLVPSPAPVRNCWATIDLSAIQANLRTVRAAAPAAAVCAVVKADAYGHGLLPVAKALAAAGADWFGVALVEEGVELRRGGVHKPILVWGQTYSGGYDTLVEYGLTPVLSAVEQFESLSAAVRRRHLTSCAVHVEVDTGMARVGVPLGQLSKFLRHVARFCDVIIDGLMTHPANADRPGDPFNQTQQERWEAAVEIAANCGVRPTYLHKANSPGTFSLPRTKANFVRCGLALYGIDPLVDNSKVPPRPQFTPALRWTSEVVSLHSLSEGEPVSYGTEWHADHPSRIATVAVGYADGYKWALSNKAYVLIRGRRARQVGEVCMDMCMVDVTEIPGVCCGDEVVLIGEQGGERIGVADLAKWAGTISYEIICSISRRVPRRYLH